MKAARHAMILQLIQEYPIETQEELVSRLCAQGYDVTQATVSRDIKELRLVKTASGEGQYRYALVDAAEGGISQRYIDIFCRSVLSITSAGNLIVVKVIPGSANVAGEAVDTLHWPGIAGCLAGDNTLFIAVHDQHDVALLIQKFRSMCREHTAQESVEP
jgi:arginine repressor